MWRTYRPFNWHRGDTVWDHCRHTKQQTLHNPATQSAPKRRFRGPRFPFIRPVLFCAPSQASAITPELQAAWININCSASRVLHYRSGLFSINHQLKGDCLGLNRFSCRPLCDPLWSRCDLFTTSDLVNIDECKNVGQVSRNRDETLLKVRGKGMKIWC